MKFISLFAGIGGLDLGLERAGMECVAQVEINEFCQKILTKHWPNVPKFKDVRDVGKHNLPPAELICGGFPCQPHSVAGKKQASNDERDLWPEYARVIREIEPRWIVAENVTGLLSSENGRFFGGVLRDLAECGYDVEWRVLPASRFGAPHQRERVFVIAYRNQERRFAGRLFDTEYEIPRNEKWNASKNIQQWAGWKHWISQVVQDDNWFGTYARVLGMANGVSNRVERVSAMGNAVVPQVAELIGNVIVKAETRLTPPAPDAWESADLEGFYKPEVLSTSQNLSTPTPRR